MSSSKDKDFLNIEHEFEGEGLDFRAQKRREFMYRRTQITNGRTFSGYQKHVKIEGSAPEDKLFKDRLNSPMNKRAINNFLKKHKGLGKRKRKK